MIGIHNDGGIGQVGFLIEFFDPKEILIMVIGNASSGVIDITAKNST